MRSEPAYGRTLTGCQGYAAAISSVVGTEQRESKRGVLLAGGSTGFES